MSHYPLRTWIEIDQQAFNHNIASYQAILAPQNVNIGVVVKSNAYGHGILEIAHLCQINNHVSYLFVVMLSEALQLRAAGIQKPILVMGIIDEDPALAILNDIDLLVYSKSMIDNLHAIAARLKKMVAVHLKVDTGLSRLGIDPTETIAIAHHVQMLPFMRLQGISSHFAESNNENLEFTHLQLSRFNNLLQKLAQNNITVPIRHMANSAASSILSLKMMNLVRIGAGALGLPSSAITTERTSTTYPPFSIKPVLSWHTRIMNIRTIAAGNSVGYDRTYTTTKETTIALLPIGYGDGYSKRLSNKAHVLLKKQNKFVPVIGRVAMNLATIDITSIGNVSEGDEVIVLGSQEQISANTLAQLTEGFNAREITVQINQSIARKITQPRVGADTKILYTKENNFEKNSRSS